MTLRQAAVVAIVVAVLVPPTSLTEQSRSPATVEEFIAAIEAPRDPEATNIVGMTLADAMRVVEVPGVSVAVIRDFDVHWARGWGVADVVTRRPVEIGTLFQAASISKPVAAMGVLKAVEEGYFGLDDDINGILTSWRLDGGEFTRQQAVTPRQLTSHTSGLGDGFGFPGYDPGMPLPSLVDILEGRRPSNVGPVFMERPPMTVMKYSGGGVTLMQLALTDATGRPFADLLQDWVLDPIGMTASTFEQPLPTDRAPRAARAHDRRGATREVPWHVYPEQAAAGLWTTPTDLARFAIEVQRAARGDHGRAVSRASAREMLTPVGVGDYAVGFGVAQRGGGWYFRHGGSNWGYRALLIAHMTKGYGLVVMTNGDAGSVIADEILERVQRAYRWDSVDNYPAR